MPGEKILAVDDEEDILELVGYNLKRSGFEVVCAGSGEEALQAARSEAPDLVLLDLMLPGIDGLEVCKLLKNDPGTSQVPVLVVSAKGEEADVVAALELGADDYITKPFSPRVLLARVKAVLRRAARAPSGAEDAIRIHELVINPGRHEVLVKNKPVELTYTEFKLLHHLAKRPGWVFTRERIIDAVRGTGYAVTDRSVDVQVAGLRKKLGPCGKYLETVRGVGYRFKD